MLNSPVLSQRKLRQLLALAEFARRMPRVHRPAYLRTAKACEDALAAPLRGSRGRGARRRACCCCSPTAIPSRGSLPIHALLATGAVHHHLVRVGLRCDCNLIIETGTARDPHHFACLIGYGATAVYPYLAYQTLFDARCAAERWKASAATKPPSWAAAIGADIEEGPAEDHVEDGHLHHRQLSRRAAVRDRRPGRRGGRPVLPRHAQPHPGRATSPTCEADSAQLAERAWNRQRGDGAGRPAQVRPRRRIPHVQPGRDRHACSARCAAASYADYQVYAEPRRTSARRRPCATCCALRREHCADRRSTRSSRSRRSSRASIPPACRWARCRRRRTRRWPSR